MFSKSIVKYIQSLQHKKFRDEHRAFVAEGPRVVGELLKSRQFKCNNIYATSGWIINYKKDLLTEHQEKITEVKDFELEKLASFSSPNSVIAEFRIKENVESVNFNNRITLMLDDIRDPGNFGTIIRIADWFGIENIICSADTVDVYNPKVVQSTMASLGRVNIIYGDIEYHIKNNPAIKTYAATLDGKDIKETGKIKEGMIIIGNEAKGISSNVLDRVNEKITIPRYGVAESLNAAVATGIILYALVE
ncbi:MAG: RNA methyltransferase [Ferruginibacter sp.]